MANDRDRFDNSSISNRVAEDKDIGIGRREVRKLAGQARSGNKHDACKLIRDTPPVKLRVGLVLYVRLR